MRARARRRGRQPRSGQASGRHRAVAGRSPADDLIEDPSVAAVFGGSPSGILETIVDGQTRYRQGETAWQEVRSTASAARRRMLAYGPAEGDVRRSPARVLGDQLFFNRLRNHAKPVFVFLVIVFAFSFVLFGVGSGSGGVSDVFGNFFNRTSAAPRLVSSLQKKAAEHPKDPKAWRELATALEQKDKTDEAIVALTRYTVLKPKDDGALQEARRVYLRRADDFAQQYVAAQSKAQTAAPGESFKPPSSRRSRRRSSTRSRTASRNRRTGSRARPTRSTPPRRAKRSSSTSSSPR